MATKFAIIIPMYKAHGTICRALDSIVMQTLVNDTKVFLIDDCDPTGDYQKDIEPYVKKLNIELHRCEKNGGPSVARNVGIELIIKQAIPYVTFMDADDCFYCPLTLQYFHEALVEKNYDFICGSFIEQVKSHNDGHLYYRTHEDRHVWLFSKLYKTRIIRDNHIRFFNPAENEDVAFNLNYSLYADTAKQLDQILYMWRWQSSSITRVDDGAYSQRCLIGLYKNCIQVYDKFQHDPTILKERYKLKVAQRMIMMYTDWNLRYEDYTKEVSSELFDLMRKFYFLYYKPLERTYTKRDLLVCGNGIFRDKLDDKARMPFMDFIKKLNSTTYKQLYDMALQPKQKKGED